MALHAGGTPDHRLSTRSAGRRAFSLPLSITQRDAVGRGSPVPAADSVGVRRLSTLSPSAAIRTVCNRRCGHRTAFTIRQCAAEPGHPDMLARIGTSAAGGAGLSTDLTGWRYSPALLRIPASSLRLGLRPCILLNCLSRWLSWDSRARASVRTASGSALSLASYSCMPRAMSRRARAQNRSRQSRNSERARAWGSRRRGPAGVLAAHRPRRERLIEDDRLRAVARPAVDGDGACVWAQVSGEDPGQRPLPGSVLADTATSSPAATSSQGRSLPAAARTIADPPCCQRNHGLLPFPGEPVTASLVRAVPARPGAAWHEENRSR